MTTNQASKAVVLLSGGLDSSTCLAIALDQGYACYGLSFDYGQRSQAELQAAIRVAEQTALVEHKVLPLTMADITTSALTDHSIAVPEEESSGVPVTYVPARNTLFLSYALAWAEVIEADTIFIGVNALDYSGYPDCRPAYIAAFQQMANLATNRAVEGASLRIEAPLMDMTKAEIIRLGSSLGLDYSLTVSCYQADEEGRACGRCDSCRLRQRGFEQAGIQDVTRYQSSAHKA